MDEHFHILSENTGSRHMYTYVFLEELPLFTIFISGLNAGHSHPLSDENPDFPQEASHLPSPPHLHHKTLPPGV